MRRLTVGVLCLSLTVVCRARTITVDDDGPADFNNIQAAIDDANNGDTVIVADGTYTGIGNRDLDFKGKAITVQSESGPESCIIDCEELIGHRGFYFHNGEEADSVVDGLTITGGYAQHGGGVYCYEASPTIRSCVINNNRTVNGQSELYTPGGNAGNGAGLCCENSSLRIDNCLIMANRTGEGGDSYGDWLPGGGGEPIPAGPGGNGGNGAGVYCDDQSSAVIVNCLITSNVTGDGGDSGDPYIPGANGGDGGDGGGIYCAMSAATVTNCTISGNETGAGGIAYDTYFEDGLAGEGGGVCSSVPGGDFEGNLIIADCIIYSNHPDQIVALPGQDPDVTYTCVQGGHAGTGNIDADPCFADEGGGDYHLLSAAGRWDPNTGSWVIDSNTSLCIDAGNPGCPPGTEPAPNGNRINMGAYGGTSEASKSPENWAMLPDLTNDHEVDSNDLKVLTYDWLESGTCLPSDFSRDQLVNSTDFAILALEWSGQIRTAPGIEYQIGECDMGLQDAGSGEPNFSVWVEGRYIHFEDMIYANCCPDELGLERHINGNQITLYEIGYGGMCDCDCNFPVTATLGPFEPGTYTVEVFDNYGQSLGVVVVVIGGPDEPGMAYHIPDCDPQAPTSLAATQTENTRFTLTVEGQYLRFEDMMVANCCPDNLELEMTVDQNLITIREIETTTSPCRCTCEYPVTAIFGPFQEGTYTVEVFDNYGQSLGAVEVVIGGSGGPNIAYTIADCDPAAFASFAPVQSQQTRFTVNVEGQYIHFEDMMVANCCPGQLGLEMTVDGNIITIHETEYTPGGCWCICDYPVTATLGPFEPGTYTLEVYEDYGGFIGSAIVVIGAP
ncbi:MAG: hypothetical protein ACYTEL_14005 [Planctomycetota bacterium]